jgi:peptide-methionine (R)-S-oxide reductase
MQLSEEEWKKRLTPEQYKVLREKGTEAPFSGKLVHENRSGDYKCSACKQVLFKSGTKFESTTPGLIGWPAFSEVSNNDAVELKEDKSLGMTRTEVVCKNCGSHLGHFFEDPASPNGQHYCINSTCLAFDPDKQL